MTRDPTELGTYMSSTLCPTCGGLVHLKTCLSCGEECSAELQAAITQLAEEMGRELSTSSHCHQLREGLAHLRTILSYNHHILTRARQVYIQHAGKEDIAWHSSTEIILLNHLYLTITKEILVITPRLCKLLCISVGKVVLYLITELFVPNCVTRPYSLPC